jgi:hypothetical protein
MLREELDGIVERYDLVKRTFDSFWICFENYLTGDITREESREYGLTNKDQVEVRLYGYSFVVSKKFSREFIKVDLDVYKKDCNPEFAEYSCIYSLDGECEDDSFVIT